MNRHTKEDLCHIASGTLIIAGIICSILGIVVGIVAIFGLMGIFISIILLISLCIAGAMRGLDGIQFPLPRFMRDWIDRE